MENILNLKTYNKYLNLINEGLVLLPDNSLINLIDDVHHAYRDMMSEYIAESLEDYFANENPNNKILQTDNRAYLKTLIYKYKDACNNKNINIETLLYNYKALMEILNSYHGDEIQNKKIQAKCNEERIKYTDFKEFLRLKKAYEEGLK